ncbi:MAG: dephospho-CoA kinase [Verrucomicrobiota bacterium]
MKIVIVTGGIAMGKSTACRRLRAKLPSSTPFFDADACVHNLLTHEDLVAQITSSFGDDLITPDGQLDRPRLRKLVFDSADRRAELEGILHPEVRREFEDLKRKTADEAFFLADIPLFFESQSPYPADFIVVVGTSSEIQKARLLARPGISESDADKIISTQLPIEDKIAAADAVLFNDGTERCLEQQIDYLTQWLTKKIPSSFPTTSP